jgi:tyrosyl-tRNA synthetase
MATDTNPQKINQLLTRGVEKVYPDKKSLEDVLLSGKKIRLYCGFDPTAKSLHIGNAIQINKLAQFQKLGHEVIFLVGDFTGMIGDPTDKSSTRKKLTREDVLENSKQYKEQASIFLNFDGDNPALIKHNSEWSDKVSFKDLIEITSNFTVQQMIQRDMFQERMKQEKPIHLHEFLYPVAQAYDSVAMDVDLELGGNDQMFNMMCGRDLMKVMKDKEKFVLTTKLLEDPSGAKMGKSEGNVISLDETPEDIYGKVMSWPDGVISVAFEICTNIPIIEIEEIKKQLESDSVNPRDLKMKLAFEMTKLYTDEEKANQAQDKFVSVIQNKEAPEDIQEFDLANKSIIDALVESKLVTSKSDARRAVEQNGVKINEQVVKDFDAILNSGDIVQKGKRFFVKVK